MYQYTYTVDGSTDRHIFMYKHDVTSTAHDRHDVKDFVEAIAQYHFENHLGVLYSDLDWPVEIDVTDTDGNFICSGTVCVEFEPRFSVTQTIHHSVR